MYLKPSTLKSVLGMILKLGHVGGFDCAFFFLGGFTYPSRSGPAFVSACAIDVVSKIHFNGVN